MSCGKGTQVPGFEITSTLKGDLKEISTHLLSMDGVNYELFPLVKMTAPPEWADKPLIYWPLKSDLFTSTILLFGLIPVDLHKFKLKEVHISGFNESSSSTWNKEWHHQRTISEQGSGCLVHDVVEYVPNVSLLGRTSMPVYKAIFRHRHRRLRTKYGTID